MSSNPQPQPRPLTTPVVYSNIANRLYQLLSTILKDSSVIPAMYHGVILNLVRPYLQKASELELSEMILKLRDEIIPWILGEDDSNSSQ